MDFIVESPPSKGFTTIFVIVDLLSKMAHFVPLKGTPSATETASSFIREGVCLHCIPVNITSDCGVQFTSRFWKFLGIKHCLSSAYHPQTNGQTERRNQTLEQYLLCFSSFAQDDWASLLPLAEFAYNNSIHSAIKHLSLQTTGFTHPSFLMFPKNLRCQQYRIVWSSGHPITSSCKKLLPNLRQIIENPMIRRGGVI